MDRINPFLFNKLPTSTIILMSVCAVAAVLFFISVMIPKKGRSKFLCSALSFLLAFTITYITVFPIYLKEDVSEIPFSEKTLEIEIERSFYPEKTTRFIVKNKNGNAISSLVVSDSSNGFKRIYNNCSEIQNQNMQLGTRFIVLNWCIIYEDESGELCCVNYTEYDSKCKIDPFFKNIYLTATKVSD